MDRIARISDLIQQAQLVVEGIDERVRSGLLEIVRQLQLALEAAEASQRADADAHLARAEELTSSQMAGLLRRVLPPRPAEATEATILDRKADLVRLLDLRPAGDALLDYVVDLAREATRAGDDLTLYALGSGPLDLYYKARQLDVLQVRRRVLGLIGKGASARLLDALCGPDGVLALVDELKRALSDPGNAKEGRAELVAPPTAGGTPSAPPARTDLGGATTALASSGLAPPLPEEPSLDELTPEERQELAEIERALGAVAMIADELNGPRADAAPPREALPAAVATESRAASPLGTPAHDHASSPDAVSPVVLPTVGRPGGEGRAGISARIGWKIAVLLVLGTLLLAATIRVASSQTQRITTIAPTGTVAPSMSPTAPPPATPTPEPRPTLAIGAPTVARVPSQTSVPPMATGEPASPAPSAPGPDSTDRAPTPIPPPATGGVALARVVAAGFAQEDQQVSCAFVVQNGDGAAVAEGARYRVVAVDGGGTPLRTQSGAIAAIGRGQRLGIAGAFAIQAGQTVARCELQLGPPVWTAAASPALVTSDVVVARWPPRVDGVIRNPSPRGVSAVNAYAIAFDAYGKVVGGGMTRVGDVAANSRTPVDVPIVATAPVAVQLFAVPGIEP